MLIASALMLSAMTAGAELVAVTGPWEVTLNLFSEPDAYAVAPPEVRTVKGEEHPQLPVFNPNTGGWVRGARLKALIAQECTVTGSLHPDSVVVRSKGVVLKRGVDYDLDDFWGTLGRLEGGAVAAGQAVSVDYSYGTNRLDAVVEAADGVRLIKGEPGMALVYPPEIPAGAKHIANVWVSADTEALTDDSLYPITDQGEARAVRPVAERLLPKTLAKLRAGEKVRIVCWGDSVTVGGGVLPDMEKRYQNQWGRMLRARFPKADIEIITAAWGGSNSAQWLAQPEGAEHHFERDVLGPKADLVTIEFVNDAYLDEEKTMDHYRGLMRLIQDNGAELALITPHLVRPDWMGVESMKFDEDPRPYVAGLRRFAMTYEVALADASLAWTRLWRQGIPYVTLLGNAINHPDERGHRFFAEALMGLFPEK